MGDKEGLTGRLAAIGAARNDSMLVDDGERFLPTMGGEIAFEHIHRYMLARPLCAGKVVADVACGEGYGSAMLAESASQVYGIDLAEEAIEWARGRYAKPNLSFFQGNGLNLPLRTDSCDVVVSFETIEHVADPDRLLAEFARVLKKGGLLIVSTPDKEVYNRQRSEPNPFHIHEMYRDEFEVILRKHFKHVSLHGQQYFEGSIVLGGTKSERRFFSRPPAPRLMFTEEVGDSSAFDFAPTYLLALASNGTPPEIPLSLFVSAEHPQAYKDRYVALNEELHERDQWLDKLQEELSAGRDRSDSLEEQLADAIESAADQRRTNEAGRCALEASDTALESTRAALTEREKTETQLLAELAALTAERDAVRAELTQRDETLETLRSDQADLQSALALARQEEGRVEAAETALAALRKEMEIHNRNAGNASGELARLKSLLHDSSVAKAASEREAGSQGRLVRALIGEIQAREQAIPTTTTSILTKSEQDPSIIAGAFDGTLYLSRNLDVAEAGMDPLNHFITHGWKEGRHHSVLFDDAYYAATNPELASIGIPPLQHYCQTGWREGRDPSALFDTAYYLATYPEVSESGLDPLSHFIQHGLAKSYRPSASLDPADFLNESDRGHTGFGLLNRFHERLHSAARRLKGVSLPSAVEPEVSVIIPIHNNLALTRSCLKSIERHLPAAKFEVILVDDLSRDLTTLVTPAWGGVRTLRNPTWQGFVGSCNHGAAQSRGKYLFFLNNDTEVCYGWLDELLATFVRQKDAGLVGSKLIYPDGRLQEAGGIIWEDGSGWNYGCSDDADKPQYNYLRDVDYVSGAAIMIPRDLFWAAGGFDRRFAPGYYEDTDLAFTVRKLGYRVLYQPLSSVIHREGGTAGTDLSSGMKAYQDINRPKFIEKWSSVLSKHLPNGQTPHIARERRVTGRLLMIDATTPTPDMDAGSLTQSYFIELYQRLGFKVTFIPEDNFAHIGKYTEDLQRRGVETIHHPYCSSIRQHLEEHGSDYDLIMAYRAPRVAGYIDDLRDLAPQAKILVDTADLHFRRLMREAELTGSAAKMAEALETRDREFEVMRKADCTIILSIDELEMLSREVPEAKLAHLPLILEAPGLQAPFDSLADIAYVGGFRHNPNVDAVLYFHREIWPLIRAQLPGVRFRVIGSYPPEEICALAGPDTIIDGYVKDLGPTLGHCRLSVVPLRFGAGIKGKIGSSLSYGIPVVSTSMGAEGMALVDGADILVADDPQAFADKVCRLYSDRRLWDSLSWNGLDFVRKEYSLEVSEHRLTRILRQLGFAV